MKRTGLLLILLACAADARSPDPRDPEDHSGQPGQPGQDMHSITLTAGAPRQALAIAPLPAAPTTLILPITAIDNPSAHAFSLRASVVWSNAGAGVPGAPEVAGTIEEAVGSVTPFPSAEPGSFVLGIPEPARNLLSRREGLLTLRLTLQPIARDRALVQPLRVTLGEPAWR